MTDAGDPPLTAPAAPNFADRAADRTGADRAQTAAGRDHGGDLGAAIARFGGVAADWIDLSTGVNPVAYPAGPIPSAAWSQLPQAAGSERLLIAAARAYGVAPENRIIAAPGASALIAWIPRLWPVQAALHATAPAAAIVSPTYNEHAAAFAAAGWLVAAAPDLSAAAADAALVVVNPNNPDGRSWRPSDLRAAARERPLTVIDESFVDPTPNLSAAAAPLADNVIVLRSFGKFYGLAGLRLGFAIAAPATADRLAAAMGPWSVSGPALEIGAQALADDGFAHAARLRTDRDSRRLDAVAARAGWRLVGGTALFRLYDTPDAAATRDALAARHIWSRRFPYSPRWIRLGLPAPDDWGRLEAAAEEIGAAGRRADG